ncbi:MAG: ferrous iron transporter B [bacterium]|nr:ferrous iron transporter B [bacterium]
MERMKRILLMGNPNVGKSVIFSRLTGVHVIASNYPGTTVEYTRGFMKLQDERVEVIDVPGTYTLEPTSKAEEVAVEMLKEGDLVVNIVDATNLERNLYLTLELLERNIPVIICLNMWDDTRHLGIDINVEKLEHFLRIPVVPTCGITGEGIKELVSRMPDALSPSVREHNRDERWVDIGRIVGQVQRLTHHHHTLLERLEDASIKPLTALPIAVIVIFLAFQVIRFIGEGLIGYIFEPFFENLYLPIVMKLSVFFGQKGFLHSILIGKLIEGEIDFGQSFGLLTTGLFVPIGMVLPYVFSFYLILGFFEDLGYLPRLAVLVDSVMHRLGLHGYAVIPMILGVGCNVPGALATRILEERREKFIAATLMSIAVPCIAQIAMIVGLVGERGGHNLLIVFSTLFIIWIILGVILNRSVKGVSSEILIEIPRYHLPQIGILSKKLWMRLLNFLMEAVPFVLLGVFFVNILYGIGIIDLSSKVFAPLMSNLLGLPKEAIAALIIGFLRKDVAVGMLGPLNLTTKQLIIGSTVLAVYFPCVATFAVLIRELGIKDMLKSALIMIVVALIVGSLLNLIL